MNYKLLKAGLIAIAVLFAFSTTMFISPPATEAASATEIEREVDETIEKFKFKISDANEVIQKASGLLVLPDVYQAGYGIGGEFGEGALQINGRTINYYNMASASFGFQIGAQKKSIILAFMNDSALRNFQESENWEIGADASVAIVKVGAEGTIDTETLNKPVVAFVLGQKGLMYELSLEGSKFTKINKD